MSLRFIMKNTRVFLVILVIFQKLAYINSAKILGIFQYPSVSHQLVYRALTKELSLRGHQVVVAISAVPFNNPELTNLTEILIRYPVKKEEKLKDLLDLSYTEFFKFVYRAGLDNAKYFLQDKRIKNLCTNNETFDLVIVEAFFPMWYAFGEKCKAITVGITPMDALLSSHTSRGNPIHSALYGDFMMGHLKPPSIWEKLQHTYYIFWYKWFNKHTLMYKSDTLINKYIGKDYPKTADMEKNCSLLLVNTNLFLCSVRPLVPSTILLGFMHIRPAEPLAKDLQTILDGAKEGVVYFSLGSNVKSSGLPAGTVNVIKEALSELPYTILLKWETDDVPDVGRNVVTRKWFPQQDLLAHPNVKAFVTQGGLQSTEEAIIYGVPMVGMPFFCDQEMNVKKSKKLGISIYLDKKTMTKDSLKRSVLEIMRNKRYHEKIEEIQKIAKDQPMTGLERAVWWTEYVIRHKGARHLRSPAADISLFEYLLLDVILVVLSGVILVSFLFYTIVKILMGIWSNKRQEKLKKT